MNNGGMSLRYSFISDCILTGLLNKFSLFYSNSHIQYNLSLII